MLIQKEKGKPQHILCQNSETINLETTAAESPFTEAVDYGTARRNVLNYLPKSVHRHDLHRKLIDSLQHGYGFLPLDDDEEGMGETA